MPIVGSLLDEFLQWMHDEQHYTLESTNVYLRAVPKIVRWLGARQIRLLPQLTLQHLQTAHRYFRTRHLPTSGAVRLLERFLRAKETVPEGEVPALSQVQVECDRFVVYLRETRGFAEATIQTYRHHTRNFLRFLRFEHAPSRLGKLQPRQIESFLRYSAQTNNRVSMQRVVTSVRAFLQFQHAQGCLARPLHRQIDTPRVYRGERLPRALPWDQVQALLQSIDRSDACGRRDFALLYLAAAYGLRAGELVRLTLDDIDWSGRTLCIRQTKTRQLLQLPLTDEAATVLIGYLRQSRPESTHRQLFLSAIAPRGPLHPEAIRAMMASRLQRSGLNLPACGTHVLRHSFAMRLLQQGAPLKAIGDALGHRDMESTTAYIRLDVDSLREVALPVPAAVSDPVTLVAVSSLPPLRPARPSRHLPEYFHSRLASSLQRYLKIKRALGRQWKREEAMLKQWDDFMHREFPQSGRVRAEMFTGWTRELVHPTTERYRVVRNFLLFHARDHARTFIPDLLTFPKPAPVVTPRLITETEMGRVLAAARRLPPRSTDPLRAETLHLGLILLFCCGLRKGELLRLQLGDLEAGQTVLRIRLTKFYKSRLVPLSPTVAAELKEYLQTRRRKQLPMAPESFLMWSGYCSSEHYSGTSLQRIWHQLWASTQAPKAQGGTPRLHDLRHSFAVNALQRWYAQGAEVQSKLPHLATYLGHVNIVSTHYYLKFTPELRQLASQQFHQHFGSLFTAGGAA